MCSAFCSVFNAGAATRRGDTVGMLIRFYTLAAVCFPMCKYSLRETRARSANGDPRSAGRVPSKSSISDPTRGQTLLFFCANDTVAAVRRPRRASKTRTLIFRRKTRRTGPCTFPSSSRSEHMIPSSRYSRSFFLETNSLETNRNNANRWRQLLTNKRIIQ